MPCVATMPPVNTMESEPARAARDSSRYFFRKELFEVLKRFFFINKENCWIIHLIFGLGFFSSENCSEKRKVCLLS